MKATFKRSAIALMLAPALALPAALHAQNLERERMQQQPVAQAQNGYWDSAVLYNRNMWSAEEMIDSDVVGPRGEEIGEVKDIIVDQSGRIQRVVVEVGGFLEMGDQHIGVPWRDVNVGPNMAWVQVPLREVESGTYSLYGRVPQGEDVVAWGDNWRVNELIGDYAALEDAPRYGMVTDVIFNQQGQAQGVIVNRTAGAWGGAGWYGYPYYGYYGGAYAYPLPYNQAEIGNYGERFDYVRFSEASEWAGAESRELGEQAMWRERRLGDERIGAAAGGTLERTERTFERAGEGVERTFERTEEAIERPFER